MNQCILIGKIIKIDEKVADTIIISIDTDGSILDIHCKGGLADLAYYKMNGPIAIKGSLAKDGDNTIIIAKRISLIDIKD